MIMNAHVDYPLTAISYYLILLTADLCHTHLATHAVHRLNTLHLLDPAPFSAVVYGLLY